MTVKAREDTDAANDKVTLTHTAAGGEYAGAKSDLAVTVDDDETVSVVLSKTTLTVDEEGADGETYTVKLSHEPSVEITVTVSGQDQTDLELTGLGEGNTLTFSTTTWDDAQTVTVKAREDADAKNDKVTLTHTGAGGEYEGVAEELVVTVDDDETVSIVLSKTTLTVDEEGADGETYTVKLSHEPSVEITVTVSGQDQTDLEITGLGEGNTLTFSTTTWDDAQTVTVKAREDADAKNDSVTLTHTGAGGEYEGVAEELAVTVDDDETVSIVLSKTTLTVDEEDADGETYTVKLSHEPSVEVTVTVTGQDTTDLELSGLSGTDTLTFSTTTWDDAQTVTVKAREDADAKNDSVTLVHTAAGGEYEGVAEELAVTVDDDETLGVVISPTALTVQAGGSNSYTVVLGSLPSGDVTVTLSGHEGAVLSLAGIDNDNALTFTQDNWHAPQTVSVSADAEAQSSTITIEHSVASADDPDYAAAAAPDVAVSVLGAPDTIQIQVGVATSVQELEVPEGGANTYSMVLSHQPSGDVTVTVNNPTDNSEVTATPRTLTFTTENWHAPQTVTVAAVHDGDAADDSATVTHGVADGGYNGVTVPDVAVTVDDDETVSIVLSKSSLTVVEGDTAGQTYTVKLSHEPSVEVTVTVTGQDQTDLDAERSERDGHPDLQHDHLGRCADGDGEGQRGRRRGQRQGHPDPHGGGRRVRRGQVRSCGDGGRRRDGVGGAEQDHPDCGRGGRRRRDLYGQAVARAVGGGHGDGVRPGPDRPGDHRPGRGEHPDLQHDHLGRCADGDGEGQRGRRRQERLRHPDPHGCRGRVRGSGRGAGGDGGRRRDGLHRAEQDHPDCGRGGRRRRDLYGQAVARAVGEITVTVSGQDQTDLEITGLGEGNTLTFSTTSWGVAQTVTVKAREDTDAANDKVTLVHTAAGGEYAGAKSDVAVTVDDDETVSVVLSKTSLTVVEGDTAGQTYTVKLSHEPSVEVTVTVTGQDQTDLTLSGLSGTDTLTFSTTTWDDAQTVTVKAREDTDAKNDSVTLVHTAAGGEYAGAKSDVAVTVDDDETVSVVLSKSSLTVVEGDADGPDLHGEAVPRAVGRGDGDGDRPGHHGPGAHRPGRGGHPDLRRDQLGGCADGDGEGQRGHRRQANDSVTLVHTAAGGEYAGAKSDVAVTVDDDETVSVVLSKTSLTVVEGDTAGQTYTVKLSHEPSVEVTVTVTGQDTTDLELTGLSATRHPDLQHDHLGRCADGDGEGQRGHRRQERLRHPGPHGGGRRVRRGQVRCGGDGGRRRDGVGGAEQDIAYGGRGRRRRPDLYGQAVPRAVGRDHGDGDRPRPDRP